MQKNNFKFRYAVVMLFAATSVFAACSKKTYYDTPRPQLPVEEEQQPGGSLVSMPEGWSKQTDLTSGFPDALALYRNNGTFNGIQLNAYCLVLDPKNSAIEFKPVLPDKNKKPSALYAEEPGTVYACVNAGYFGTNVSYSLVIQNSTVLATNVSNIVRAYNGNNVNYYITRGAFGLTSAGVPEVTWVYNIGSGTGVTYSYTEPAANKEGEEPKPVPTTSYPAGAKVWNAKSAVGGSPVLLKNSEVRLTDVEEMISVDNTIQRARTAIGFNADGKVFILVAEGNNPNGAKGLTLLQLANLMKSIGCKEALNLDGGGSTSMVVNGQLTVRPSDAAGERPVMSAIIIKRK